MVFLEVKDIILSEPFIEYLIGVICLVGELPPEKLDLVVNQVFLDFIHNRTMEESATNCNKLLSLYYSIQSMTGTWVKYTVGAWTFIICFGRVYIWGTVFWTVFCKIVVITKAILWPIFFGFPPL